MTRVDEALGHALFNSDVDTFLIISDHVYKAVKFSIRKIEEEQ